MSDASTDPLLHRAHPLIAAAVRAIVSETAPPPLPTGGIDRHLRTLRLEADDALRRQPARLVRGFDAALAELLAEAAVAPAPPTSFDALELVDAEQTREQIELARIAREHMHALAPHWAPLLARLQPPARALVDAAGASPISPEGLTQALWRGSEQLPLSPGARVELVRQVMVALAPTLAALYDDLAPPAPRPDAPGAATAPGQAARPAPPLELVPLEGSAAAGASPTFDVTRPGALRELLPLMAEAAPAARAGRPRPAGAAAATPDRAPAATPATPAARAAAGGGQQGAPRSPRHTDRAAAAGDDVVAQVVRRHRAEFDGLPADAEPWQVMELIARIFDQITAQQRLPDDAQALVARLQEVVVQVALHDPTLLDTHQHPAWVFTNKLVTQLRLQVATDPAQLEVFLRWVSGWFTRWQAEPAAGELEAAAQRLVQWQRLQASRRLTDVEPALNLLRLNAWLEPHVEALRPALQATLADFAPHDTVRRFVMDIWALVVAHQQAQGLPADDAQACLRELLWSTDAARCRSDRAALLALLPGLAQRLEQGMQSIGVDEARRHAWMDRLAALHKLVMQRERPAAAPAPQARSPQSPRPPQPAARAAAPEPPAPVPAASPPPPPAPAPPQPQPRAAATAAAADGPPAAEAAAPAAPGAAATPAEAAGPAPDLLARLQVGDALRLQLQGHWCVSQLLWMSDNGHFLLFSGAAPGVSHSFTRRALERLLRAGLVQPLADNQVLQQAAQGLRRGQ